MNVGKIASTFDHARSMERQLHIRFLSSPVEFIANINCPEKYVELVNISFGSVLM
jgi:hypothetical protein